MNDERQTDCSQSGCSALELSFVPCVLRLVCRFRSSFIIPRSSLLLWRRTCNVERDALDVRVDDNVLTIQGQTRHIAPGEPVWTEYQLLNFYRQFELPEDVDQEKIGAELQHGVLTVHLPKLECAKPRQIQINVR
jgi:hypothetical protein